MISDDPTIVALGAAREAAWRAVMAVMPGAPPLLLDPRPALDTYTAALAACPIGSADLLPIRDELVRRLEKGLTLAGNDQVIDFRLDHMEVFL